MDFNHFDEHGNAVMVDVSAKQSTLRTAVAEAVVRLSPRLLSVIREHGIAKGDVLGVARLAGIMAAKKTPELIPLSHPLALHSVAVDFTPDGTTGCITVQCTVRAMERTGVEMEAMTGAAVAALTIYDMCKGSDKSIAIGEIRLLYKEGGKSGMYRREEEI
ncbi:MAG TPA: cyclic pyranopterin monophosphate synthase MoaC [Geobacteraceae bacterium]